MQLALVGCTGFVGGNLAASHPFDGLYNSKNIETAFGTQPDVLLYAGMPAAKYLANTDPDGDLAVARGAFENICRIAPKKPVLISTVDVYETPCGVDEAVPASAKNPAAYGRNRTLLEQWVREAFPDALIVRLPGLFGAGLKKNFLYDFMVCVPAMLKAEKYEQLAAQNSAVGAAYAPAKNGFYALQPLAPQQKTELRAWFAQNSFNALSFTDSRSVFQFYDLSRLWRDLSVLLAAGAKLVNLATPPLCAAEIYAALTHGQVFANELSSPPARYNMRTRYDVLLGGADGYICTRDEALEALCAFVRTARKTI